ncbi:MAG: 50S ribosomal protein L21 [Planctomycetes bacterium]|nr:50S ribosomal protein L21 [Planctomycetota bacterium]
MYAILKDRGRQYKVQVGDLVRIDKLPQKKGDKVTFDNVLLVGKDGNVQVGNPKVAGAKVIGVLEDQAKGEKLIAMRRIMIHSLRTRRGHRAQYSMIRIEKIEA